MNRLALIVLLFLSLSRGMAQHVSNVNFDEINVEVSDSTSALFYPQLIKRILANDTTLNKVEFKHLYYGNVFQNYYHPYGATEKQKLFFDAYRNGDAYKNVEALGLSVLKENPVDLDVILKMVFLYNREKDVSKATLFAKIYVSFLEVIYASGSGQDCENGFVVISVDDEYRITGDLGLTVIEQALIGSCDRLIFSKKGQKRKNRIKGLYFNVRMPLTYLSKSFDQSDLPEADAEPDEEEE